MDALTWSTGPPEARRCWSAASSSVGATRSSAPRLGQLQAAVRHHIDQEESLFYTIFRKRARRAEVDLAPSTRRSSTG